MFLLGLYIRQKAVVFLLKKFQNPRSLGSISQDRHLEAISSLTENHESPTLRIDIQMASGNSAYFFTNCPNSLLTFTCSKSTIETLEKGVKYFQS